MFRKITLFPLIVSSVLCFSQDVPLIKGAVANAGQISTKELKGLNRYKRLVKVADTNGNFLCSLELSGYALKDILDAKKLKKTDDGFNRHLDLYITAAGKTGRTALFSYGEVFMGSDEGVLLADSARMILPTHHPPLEAGKNDPTIMLDIKKRSTINLDSCVSCHDGEAYSKLHFPNGWLLIAAHDGFGGRFVENLTEINVTQVGFNVEDKRATDRDSLIENPAIIGTDGKSHAFSKEDFQKLPRMKMTDAGIGIGKGYRGTSTWEGVLLKGILQKILPNGVDPQNTFVVVTGADGYRATFSGTEIFTAPDEKCVLLADTKNGKSLGKGSGLYLVMPRTDFYVDRGVRMVKEIRLIIRANTKSPVLY